MRLSTAMLVLAGVMLAGCDGLFDTATDTKENCRQLGAGVAAGTDFSHTRTGTAVDASGKPVLDADGKPKTAVFGCNWEKVEEKK